jgi:hypothetical protein
MGSGIGDAFRRNRNNKRWLLIRYRVLTCWTHDHAGSNIRIGKWERGVTIRTLAFGKHRPPLSFVMITEFKVENAEA